MPFYPHIKTSNTVSTLISKRQTMVFLDKIEIPELLEKGGLETQDHEKLPRLVKKLIRMAISTAYHLLSVSQCLCILPQMKHRIG